jgi:hypothetical protein
MDLACSYFSSVNWASLAIVSASGSRDGERCPCKLWLDTHYGQLPDKTAFPSRPAGSNFTGHAIFIGREILPGVPRFDGN